VLGIEYVSFHATKHWAFVRGIGDKVEFLGYPLPLPYGASFGASRKAVAAKLGQPKRGREDGRAGEEYWRDGWEPAGKLPIVAKFIDDKLVMLEVGLRLP
jgi:hypothetical protein